MFQAHLRTSRLLRWLIAALLLAGVAWSTRTIWTGWLREQRFREPLPPALPVQVLPTATGTPLPPTPSTSPAPGQTVSQATPSASAPREINLAVPFAPQAPFGNWNQPYQDACEEAAIIMVERSLRQAPLTLEEMDREILRMVRFQEERFGFYRDSNSAETARLAEAFYPHLAAEVRYNVTAEDIRNAVAAGSPVIGLVDGRKLGNPFYQAPGPDRHALVIKGMVGEKFITNDPGTKRGEDFVYPASTVLNALGDYDGQTPGTHTRAIILLHP